MVDNTSIAALVIAVIAILGLFAVVVYPGTSEVDLSGLENEIVNVKISINSLDDKIDKIKTDLSDDIDDIEIIDIDKDDLEDLEDYANEFSEIDDNVRDINNLEDRMDILEDVIEDIEYGEVEKCYIDNIGNVTACVECLFPTP